MARAFVLLLCCYVFRGSQAFFVNPTSRRPTCGAIGGGWSPSSSSTCQHSSSSSSSRWGGGGRGYYARRGRDRRGAAAGGALTMKMKKKKAVKDSLEEVSDDLASKPVALGCPKTGKELVCYAERIAVVGGERYLVAFPKDPAVAIAFDENGEVSPVPNDDPIMDELFPLAEACVADLGPGVKLLRTPTTLTVQGLNELVEEAKDREAEGGGDPEVNGEGQEEEVGEGEGDDDDEEDADEVELLGEFLLEGEEFLIVRFLEPILILAKEHTPGKYLLIDEEEEQDAIPLVDEMLCGDATI
ncbi:unnamed protein product [Ectocarpus fasciculatus]